MLTPPYVLPQVSLIKALERWGFTMTARTRWLISLGWIGLTLVAFYALGATSVHSWLYLAAIALVQPIVLNSLWRDDQEPTIAEVMRGERS